MKKSFTLLTVLLLSTVLFSQKTYIWCGTLIDGVSNEPKNNMTIVVENNRITGIENGFTAVSAPNKSIDLKSSTVMPGWIDMHVHMETETNPDAYLQKFTLNPADYAYQSVRFAEVTLMAGFTSVR